MGRLQPASRIVSLSSLLALLPVAASCSKCSSKRSEQVTAAPESPKKKPDATRPSPYLDALPEGAAIYGTLRLDAVDVLGAVMPAKSFEPMQQDAQDRWGLPLTKRELAETLGLDPSRPIAFALVPGASAEIVALVHRAKVDGGTHAAVSAAYDAANASDRPPLGALRVVLPLAKGKSTAKLLELLGQLSSKPLQACDTGAECPKLGERRPAFYGPETAIYLDGETMRVDRLLAKRPTATESARWLGWLGATTGGPKTRCHALADEALVSLCLAAPELAALGEGTGSYQVLGALSSPGIDEKQLLLILEEGEKELGRNATLRDAAAGDLSDGTYALVADGDRLRLEGSWLLGKRRPKGLDAPLCAKELAETTATLLGPLRDGLLEGKPAYADLRELHEQMREAGWTGAAILAAGQWPLALPHLDASPWKGPALGGPCASLEGGRLWLRLTSDTKNVGEALRAIGL